jgi:RND family efflux transporter MFP subunit
MKLRFIAVGFAVLALAGASFFGYKYVSLSACSYSGSTTATSVRFVSSTIAADGTVTAASRENLTFQTPGKLISLPYKVGDNVYKGAVIAQLDTAMLEANLRQAEQDFTAAKAVSEKLYNDQAGKTDESYDEKIARTAVDAAQNKAYDNVVKARQAIADTTLRSSLQGIVTREDVTIVGTNVTPAATFTVSDPATMVFRANIPAGSIYYISEGAQVTLAIDGIQNKVQGMVVTIYPSRVTLPNGESVYQVDIASDDLTKQAKLDENGTAIISTNSQNVALVPAWFVLSGKYIWVSSEGKPTLRTVTVGSIHGNDIEITGGLTADDKIIVDPKFISALKYLLL